MAVFLDTHGQCFAFTRRMSVIFIVKFVQISYCEQLVHFFKNICTFCLPYRLRFMSVELRCSEMDIKEYIPLKRVQSACCLLSNLCLSAVL